MVRRGVTNCKMNKANQKVERTSKNHLKYSAQALRPKRLCLDSNNLEIKEILKVVQVMMKNLLILHLKVMKSIKAHQQKRKENSKINLIPIRHKRIKLVQAQFKEEKAMENMDQSFLVHLVDIMRRRRITQQITVINKHQH